MLVRMDEGRIDAVDESLQTCSALIRDSARACLSAFPKEDGKSEPDAAPPAGARHGR